MDKWKQAPHNSTYFILVNPFIIGFVCTGIYLLMMAWKDPDNVSPVYFGKIANFVSWIGTNYSDWVALIWWLTVVIHCVETLVSMYYCYRYGLNPLVSAMWIVQTMVLGILSLRFLIWPQHVKGSEKED